MSDSTPKIDRREMAQSSLDHIRALAAEHAQCSGCPTPWWLTQALEQR